LAYILRLRSCRLLDAFIMSSLPPFLTEKLHHSRVPLLHRHYPASLLVRTHPPPSHLRPTSRVPVIWPTLLRQFLGGTRRASPVARHVLVTVLSLSPRRSEMPLQPACGTSCRLRPIVVGSASGAMNFRGHLCVHSRYGPVTRSPSPGWLCRWASSTRFPSYLPSKLQGLWLLPWQD
jgi:hypothetical protein